MQEFFGEVRNGIMGLNELGIVANQCWLDIPRHFVGVELDEYVVMPNHVHGVIAIQSSNVGGRHANDNNISVGDRHANDNNISVGDRHACPLRLNRNTQIIPNIIGSFKSTVTRIIRKQYPDFNFAWQRSYHDRIIRNEKELNAIRRYIINNPIHWELDRNNPDYLEF
jgi:REP element-mobilizing transposase RayT